jgi:hypothetical protein
MRKILNIGSKSLRYRNNKVRSKNLYDVGLFPSLAKKLDLPNDLEEKRPTPGNPAWKRMELLEQVGYPKEDIDIFKSGYTTELEALASKFKNSDGVPIGLELFLTKNMELMDLEVKPIPSWTENELRESCGQMLRSTIRNKIYQSFSELLDLRSVIDEEVEDKIELLLEEVCGKVEEIVKSKVDLTTDEVQGKAWEYFCSHPIQERMGIETLVKEAFEVTCDKVEVDIKELKEQLRKSLNTLLKNIKPKVKVKVFDIERSSKTRGDFFKTIYKKLKIKKGDERKMEEALR